MNKLFSSLFLLFVIFLIFWSLTGWYLGGKAELAFKSAIEENEQVAGEKLLRAELLSYRKTLMGAKAILRVSSDVPLLSERIGEFQVKVRLLNGPIFITKSGISIGSSRWIIRIDETSLIAEELENLKYFFPSSLPMAIVRLDFEQKAHYLARAQTAIAQSLVTGVLNLDTLDNRGAITLDNLNTGIISNLDIENAVAEKVNISYQHQKAITAAYKPGTTSIHIPSLQLKLNGLQNPLLFGANLRSNISSDNNYLSGFIKVELDKQMDNEFPVDSLKSSLSFKGISAEGFIAFSEAHAELDNLQQQIGWVLEENGAYPEGQDQIWKLYDRIEAVSSQLPDILVNKVLNNNSLIQLGLESLNDQGSSGLSGKLKINNNIKNIKNRGGVFKTLFSLLQGEAKVTLDDELYPVLSNFIPINKQEFKLVLKDNKLLMQ